MHYRAMTQIAPALRARVVDGPLAWAKLTLERLERLPGEHATPSPIMVNEPNESEFGMCGVLRPM